MTDLSNSPIGKSLLRREDARFLTGAGQYTDDVTLPGQTHGYFLRSPHAHARIRSIVISRAKKAQGVVAVFTGDDLAVRISAIVDARFNLIVDGETASSRTCRGGAQVPGRNVAQPSTISLKRSAARGVAGPVLGLD